MKHTLRLLALVLLLVIPNISAQEGHIKLLAIGEGGGNFTGSVADLYLTIQPGSGRVFIETFPLTKIDTQISTRFAQEIACKYLDKDCDVYDFFYTIQSPAAIVGGPSAGAAIATLTVAALEGIQLNDSVAMTGTINSGALIGPVGSIKEKIYAAKQAGLSRVLVPTEQMSYEEHNKTINIADLAARWNIQVTGVESLDDSLAAFSGKNHTRQAKPIIVDERYVKTMQGLGRTLCDRAKLFSRQIRESPTGKERITEQFVKSNKDAEKLLEKGLNALSNNTPYSAASFCFGASVALHSQLLYLKNLSGEQLAAAAFNISKNINAVDNHIEQRERKTITDLQAYMIIKERLLDARGALDEGTNSSAQLAYASERLESAISWQRFFGVGDGRVALDEKSLRKSCLDKLSEVGERYQYISLFFPDILTDIHKSIIDAYDYYGRGDYELCLFKAIQTKAETDVLSGLIGVKQEAIDALLTKKLAAAEREIAKQIDDGVFPILAYSYYEYANTLSTDQKTSALIYAEYALEMSDLDIYFRQSKEKTPYDRIAAFVAKYSNFVLVVFGALVGALVYGIVSFRSRKSEKYTLHHLPHRKKRKKIRVRN
ncbi:hypothetical protein HY772_07915 [Candidatus Woesearchaeota archaeon]|nr:hypothetical protein [Candidatus Woesearchaeota archaeon]